MIFTFQSNFCASRGRIIPGGKLFEDQLRTGVILPVVLLASGNTPKSRVEGGLTHLPVACTDVSPRPEVECRRRNGHRGVPPALEHVVRHRRRKRTSQSWLVTVEFRNIQQSALERVLDSRRFEVVRCVAQIVFFALRINLLTVVEHKPLVFLHQCTCFS
jgi:hypothetical protein